MVFFSTLVMAKERKPNIIIIMTDDQGYGDLGHNFNPVVKTPNIDQLASESIRFTNFHMDPTCSPSRSSLLTGKYSMRAGVWHTIMGRSLLPTQHTTLPEALQSAGYKTAIFGKWHLGDNYPFRPEDQGFDETLIHGGGGVGQTPDYWGNTQFSDTYFRNGQPEKFSEYATNVWFDEATKFIEDNKEKPFFAYISTNAPHRPWRAPKEYIQPYLDLGLPKKLALFYAMITHLDSRILHLRETLQQLDIADNTLLIFTTDNGSSMKSSYDNIFGKEGIEDFIDNLNLDLNSKTWDFNAGMKGFKASVYEGGHRVPLLMHWPKEKSFQPRDIDTLTAHFDLMPTILDIAKAPLPKEQDGQSLLPILKGEKPSPSRTLFITNQRVDIPSPERPSVVMTQQWRYVLHEQENKIELFDILKDPQQLQDVKSQHPAVVKQLHGDFERWWEYVTSEGFERQRIIVGSHHENPSRLTSMDWMEATSEIEVPWFPGFQRPQDDYQNSSWMGRMSDIKPLPWYLSVKQSDKYTITLYLQDIAASKPIERQYAFLELNGKRSVMDINKLANGVSFTHQLKQGKLRLKAWFANDLQGKNNILPAFYAYVEREYK